MSKRRLIGLQRLIDQVETMYAESGDPEVEFDAEVWLSNWLEQPLPALDNKKPSEFMNTIKGQNVVSSILAKMQSGAYG